MTAPLALVLALVAVPPLPPFPTEVRPRDATTAPANSAVFALGDPAPPLDSVGIAVTVAGAPVVATPEAVGCCVVRARLATPPAEGESVTVTITSPSGDRSATWTAGPEDDTPPAFTADPVVLDHGARGGAYEVVVGVDVADDTQVGMIQALFPRAPDGGGAGEDPTVVGATVDGFILTARLPADLAPGAHCLSLVVVDVAENAGAPAEACFTVAGPGEGEGEGEGGEGEGEGEPPAGCTALPTAPLALALLALLARRPARARRPAALAVLAALVALALGAGEARAATHGGRGVAWVDAPLAQVLARAKAEKKLVLVEVWAAWCAPCKQQSADVFETEDGAALTRDLLAWRVDFDDPAQRALMERWNVLSLPTVMVLRPDGTPFGAEVDRIEGYATKDAFLAEARAIAKGKDPLPALEKKLAKAPDDLGLVVDVAHRKLVRGDPVALSMLERVIVEDRVEDAVHGGGEHAQRALFLLGRYHARARRDFAAARHVWRELYTRFPAGTYASTAAWWYAGALHETGDTASALRLLERRARAASSAGTAGFDRDAVTSLVDFVVERRAGADVARRVIEDAARARALDDAARAALLAKLDAKS